MRKGNQWYFGMKIHIGTNVDSGAVHSVNTTTANVTDITELPNLTRGEDQVIFADVGYSRDSYRRGPRHMGVRWCVNDKRKGSKNLSSRQRKRNRKQSAVRERVKHVFRVIKRQFDFQKTRYRELEKNPSQVSLRVGLANLCMIHLCSPFWFGCCR